MYDEITRKLGCEVRDVAIPCDTTENDSLGNPFEVLTVEEIEYIRENDFFPEGRPVAD
jgi:hypothetical protein